MAAKVNSKTAKGKGQAKPKAKEQQAPTDAKREHLLLVRSMLKEAVKKENAQLKFVKAADKVGSKLIADAEEVSASIVLGNQSTSTDRNSQRVALRC